MGSQFDFWGSARAFFWGCTFWGTLSFSGSVFGQTDHPIPLQIAMAQNDAEALSAHPGSDPMDSAEATLRLAMDRWDQSNLGASRVELTRSLQRVLKTAPHIAYPMVEEKIKEDQKRKSDKETNFEKRYWLIKLTAWLPLQKAAQDSAPESVNTWLNSLARNEKRWMLRVEALSALKKRGAPTWPAVAEALLKDPYPRVRARAAQALRHRPQATPTLRSLLQHDPWSLVRAEALEALAATSEATTLLCKAFKDPSLRVRARAQILWDEKKALSVDPTRDPTKTCFPAGNTR